MKQRSKSNYWLKTMTFVQIDQIIKSYFQNIFLEPDVFIESGLFHARVVAVLTLELHIFFVGVLSQDVSLQLVIWKNK